MSARPTRPLPGALLPLTIPASWLLGALVSARNRRFDGGRGIDRLSRPVISIGNLTTGGVGKTPMVGWVTDELLAMGHRPVIALRGYGAAAGETSDEEAEYRCRRPAVPVVARPDRCAALTAFLSEHPDIDSVVLDDGFQHRQLHRDLDLVLIDGRAATPHDRLLPAGHLREPAASLRRADAVVITHTDAPEPALAAWVTAHHGRPPVAWSRHVWTGLERFTGAPAQATSLPVSWLEGKRVLTLLGIGRPDHVRQMIENAGAVIAADVPARDHERFSRAKLAMARGLASGVDAMVMTGKDWARAGHLLDLPDWPVPVVVPALTLEVHTGAAALRALLQRTLEALTPRASD